MSEHWNKLAARVKEAIEEEQEELRRADLAEEQQREADLAAREALIDSLVRFAEAVGHFSVDRGERRVRLALGKRWFEIDASEPEVRVDFEDAAAYVPELTRNPRRGSPWMLCLAVDGEARWLPFFDAGLEALCAIALGIEVPEDSSSFHALLFTRGTGAREKLVIIEEEEAEPRDEG
jgi:hypothetical protein